MIKAIEKYLERVPSQSAMDAHVKTAIRGIAVSDKMLKAAQASYKGWEEYGLTDADMKDAIKAALKVFGK